MCVAEVLTLRIPLEECLVARDCPGHVVQKLVAMADKVVTLLTLVSLREFRMDLLVPLNGFSEIVLEEVAASQLEEGLSAMFALRVILEERHPVPPRIREVTIDLIEACTPQSVSLPEDCPR